ncbi:hypothetical protein GCM10020358_74480 [Amorphoplanes nipponensis]|uniref:Secreted protein n=1 Tax=Actinoplanes nipponensis TaxID=135950 RepID=A0A919JD92_9ACTN|nr:hypothetical protein [Actinoplanes nipponensis]GIE48869.1 hypothetical protein Ani05nite_24030 [Actinoplanes nipponensis]
MRLTRISRRAAALGAAATLTVLGLTATPAAATNNGPFVPEIVDIFVFCKHNGGVLAEGAYSESIWCFLPTGDTVYCYWKENTCHLVPHNREQPRQDTRPGEPPAGAEDPTGPSGSPLEDHVAPTGGVRTGRAL